MKVYLTYGFSGGLYDELVDGVFHKKEDASTHVREMRFSPDRLKHLENSFGLTLTEEQIQSSLIKYIQEMEVQ